MELSGGAEIAFVFEKPYHLRTALGHDYRGRLFTTIAEEKKHNARLAGKTREQFVEIMNNLKLGACCYKLARVMGELGLLCVGDPSTGPCCLALSLSHDAHCRLPAEDRSVTAFEQGGRPPQPLSTGLATNWAWSKRRLL